MDLYTNLEHLVQRLSSNHHVHWSESAGVTTLSTSPTALLKHGLDLVSTRRNKPDLFEEPQQVGSDEHTDWVHLETETEWVVRWVQR